MSWRPDESHHERSRCQGQTIGGIGKATSSFARGYVVIVWGRSEGADADTAKTLIRAGPLSWSGLLVLFASVIVTVYLTSQAQVYPVIRATLWEGEEIAVLALAPCFSLLFMTFGWAYSLCGAAWGWVLWLISLPLPTSATTASS